MPERGTAPAVLIDGPSAGQLIYVDPGIRAWNMVKPPEPLDAAHYLDLPRFLASTSTYEVVTYQIEPYGVCTPCPSEVLGHVYFHLRVGWSQGDEPDEQAMRKHGRRALLEHPELMPAGAILWPADPADDEPIQILDHGHGPTPHCRDIFEMHPRTRLMRGHCPCGWRTEEVELRRSEELLALTTAHGRAGMEALDALIRQGVYSYGEYAAMMGITPDPSGEYDGIVGTLTAANRRADDNADAMRYAYSSRAAPRRSEPASPLDWGAPLESRDADWPEQGSTCAHLCGDSDHECAAKAATHLTYDLPSGGRRKMPICGPCYASETATKEKADA